MKSLMFILLSLLLLTGCADDVSFLKASEMLPVGFWYGLWHGNILPISWFISLFDNTVAIYAIYNSGGWYDFGFVLGGAGFLGLFEYSTTYG